MSDTLRVERFDDRFFASTQTYSALLLGQEFYERLAGFQFILVHQLDAFIFEDRLSFWCEQGYDYIGAPWRDRAGTWRGVGNGGLSLRRTQACLSVIGSRLRDSPDEYWRYVTHNVESRASAAARLPLKLLKHLGIAPDVTTFLQRFVSEGCNEDIFWGLHAARFYPSFRVAPVEAARHFSVEHGIEDTSRLFVNRPPFGCHGDWLLACLDRYVRGEADPQDDRERAVWRLAELARLPRALAEP
jgi:hypothetical protein